MVGAGQSRRGVDGPPGNIAQTNAGRAGGSFIASVLPPWTEYSQAILKKGRRARIGRFQRR